MRINKQELDDFLDGGIICGYVMIMVFLFRLVFNA